ncbi:AAEL005616-PA [Aedes aegypti]|uniref:AAEL005616-PA n=2 Tax=Aedes aegypti TaxID=7159 RepID=A0A1S4FBD3_AEDAE|nr:trypsin alpha-3 [Aedes aegypti]EAT42907.1 AAEL005616-PA [Aedes aegypti]
MRVSTFVFLVSAVVTVCADENNDAWQAKQIIPNAAKWIDDSYAKRQHELGKIIGGHKVEVTQFPYQLSLRSYDNHICGASIISTYWALTAAHCVFPQRELRTITLVAGASDRLQGGRIQNVTRIVVHPEYNPATFDNDVAVLRVKIPLIGLNIRSTLIAPAEYEPYQGIRSLVTGWGRTLTDNGLPTKLHAVDIPIVSRSTCASYWGTDLITERMICAGQEGRDSCNGDSGGPLVSGGQQIGIVSWGSTECGGPLPAVYTNIGHPKVRQFIKMTTGV